MLWIYASNAARFERSVRYIADHLKISGRNDPNANIFKLVQHWLRDARKGRWVVVLDSADDVSFLIETSTMSENKRDGGHTGYALLHYLPMCEHGSILITTRSKGTALSLVDDSDIIVVKPMDYIHALALLENKLGRETEKADITELAAALEFMPLAITQAAAYINQRGPRFSVRQYLDMLQNSDKSKASLLNKDVGDFRRDREARNSIILTWQISFEHIYRIRRSAADLLSLISFCDRQAIPELLLRVRIRNSDGDEKIEGGSSSNSGFGEGDADADSAKGPVDDASEISDAEFEDDIVILVGYSFLSITTDSSTIQTYRLVQIATRRWLETRGQLERWKEQYIHNLWTAFPPGRYENWAVCRTLFPHAKVASDLKPNSPAALLQWASVMYNASWYALGTCAIADAEDMSVQCMKVRLRELGEEHTDTLRSIDNLASVLRFQGKYEAAETMNRRALEGYEKVLGREHPDTLRSIDNLASVLRFQGKYEAAEIMNRRALEGCEKVLGREHPDTLRSIDNLASVLRFQGKYEAAETMNRRALEGYEKVLGREHPDTLRSIDNLASVLRFQGKYEAAEIMNRRALEGCEKVLGREHPDTLRSIDNLASVLRFQGKYEVAEMMNRQALEGYEKVLGREHPDTLRSIDNLASVLQDQGEHEAA